MWEELHKRTESMFEETLCNVYFEYLVWSMSHSLTWKMPGLLQPATRWQSREMTSHTNGDSQQTGVSTPWVTDWIYRYGQDDSSLKVKPKRLDRHLVAGCRIDDKPCLLQVNRWDVDKTKKYTSNKLFSNMVPVTLGKSYLPVLISNIKNKIPVSLI